MKKFLAVAVVAAIVVLFNVIQHAKPDARSPFDALVSSADCAQPQWPDEARRYEIDGITTIRFEIDRNGKVMRPAVTASSGWKILDDAALRSIGQCAFRSGHPGGPYPLQYVWKFDDAPVLHPQLVPQSCQPVDGYTSFRQMDRTPSDANGILLRFLVDAQGAPTRIVPEPNGQPAERIVQAIRFLQTCRFAYDPSVQGERTDTVYGRAQ